MIINMEYDYIYNMEYGIWLLNMEYCGIYFVEYCGIWWEYIYIYNMIINMEY